jgi:hypothetical protein
LKKSVRAPRIGKGRTGSLNFAQPRRIHSRGFNRTAGKAKL